MRPSLFRNQESFSVFRLAFFILRVRLKRTLIDNLSQIEPEG